MTVKELSEVKTSTAAVSVFKSCYNNMLLTSNQPCHLEIFYVPKNDRF